MLSLHGAGTLNHRKMKKILHLLLILFLLPLAGQASNLVSFKQVSKVTSGKRYLIVYKDANYLYVAKAISEKDQVLNKDDVGEVDNLKLENGIIKATPELYAFTFTATNKSFIIKDLAGYYLGTKGGSEVIPEKTANDAVSWQITHQNDGTFQIKNGKRYLEYSVYNRYFRYYMQNNKGYKAPYLYEEVPAPESRTLTDDMNATNDLSAAEGLDVTVQRPLVRNSWNAICLPFDMSESQLKDTFGEGVRVATLTAATDGNASFNTLSAPQIKAGKPYLLFNPGGALSEFTVSDVTFNSNITTEPTTGTDFSFVGTLGKSDISAGDYFFSTKKANTLVKQGANGTIKAFRAYLKANGNEARLSSFVVDHQTTSIANITIVAPKCEKSYNLNGQEVSRYQKGIVIRNGRKYINK